MEAGLPFPDGATGSLEFPSASYAMLPPKGIVLPRDDMDVGLSPRDLCADMAAYPHKAVVAAQGSAHVEL